jgi:hypothetical protein
MPSILSQISCRRSSQVSNLKTASRLSKCRQTTPWYGRLAKITSLSQFCGNFEQGQAVLSAGLQRQDDFYHIVVLVVRRSGKRKPCAKPQHFCIVAEHEAKYRGNALRSKSGRSAIVAFGRRLVARSPCATTRL